MGNLSPLFAGSCARTVAVLATSPVELVKTRLQNTTTPTNNAQGQTAANYVGVWQSLGLKDQV